jgi:hypothetical protein
MSEVSQELLNQRLRNRIMELLEVYSSEEGWAYLGPDEVINQWGDLVDDSRIGKYVKPAFSHEEQEALHKFNELWKEYCRSTPRVMPAVEVLKKTSKWQSLREQAASTLALFSERGRFEENSGTD